MVYVSTREKNLLGWRESSKAESLIEKKRGIPKLCCVKRVGRDEDSIEINIIKGTKVRITNDRLNPG